MFSSLWFVIRDRLIRFLCFCGSWLVACDRPVSGNNRRPDKGKSEDS